MSDPKPYDDSANLLKAGFGPPIEGRPAPTLSDREKGRELCKALHRSNEGLYPPSWYPSGCNCGTIAQLLADTREAGRAEMAGAVWDLAACNRAPVMLPPVDVSALEMGSNTLPGGGES